MASQQAVAPSASELGWSGWLEKSGMKTHHIDPGNPWQNSHNATFNGVYRDVSLNRLAFYFSAGILPRDQRLAG